MFLNLQNLWHLFWQQALKTNWLQWTAVILGIMEVLFAKANKIWLYPTGIIGTLLSIYLFYETGLFAESLLNGYFVLMSVYGWWLWIKKKNKRSVKPSYSTRKEWTMAICIILGSFIILAFTLNNFTSSTVPFWDAWISATAWAGMWLLAKRKIENWILLNISNAFAILLLIYKQLPLYAGLTIFLFFIAIQGYFQWKKIIFPLVPTRM